MLSAFDGVNHRRAPTHTTAGDYESILPKISVVCLLAERPIIFSVGQTMHRTGRQAAGLVSWSFAPTSTRSVWQVLARRGRTIILIGAKQRRRVTDPHWWRKRTAEAKMKRILALSGPAQARRVKPRSAAAGSRGFANHSRSGRAAER